MYLNLVTLVVSTIYLVSALWSRYFLRSFVNFIYVKILTLFGSFSRCDSMVFTTSFPSGGVFRVTRGVTQMLQDYVRDFDSGRIVGLSRIVDCPFVGRDDVEIFHYCRRHRVKCQIF